MAKTSAYLTKLQVQKAIEQDILEKKELPDWLTPVFGFGCGLFFLGFIVQGAILRRKLHNLEEERL